MNCPQCKKPLTEKDTWTADGITYCLGCGNEVADANNKKSEDIMDRGEAISMDDLDGFVEYDPDTKIKRIYWGEK